MFMASQKIAWLLVSFHPPGRVPRMGQEQSKIDEFPRMLQNQ
jgi:hypothetical protein